MVATLEAKSGHQLHMLLLDAQQAARQIWISAVAVRIMKQFEGLCLAVVTTGGSA